jgi:hypothetical protein
MVGLEASRRVAWAKFYDEQDLAQHLQARVAQLLVDFDASFTQLMDLAHAVLHAPNAEAFAMAYRIREWAGDTWPFES